MGGSALSANARAHFGYLQWYGGMGGKGQDCPLSVPGETLDPSECPDAHSSTDFAAGADGHMSSSDVMLTPIKDLEVEPLFSQSHLLVSTCIP